MSVEDCGNVELPPWSYSVPSLNSEQEDPSDPASKIASLLLAKLADYVVPGEECLSIRMVWEFSPACGQAPFVPVWCSVIKERWEREGSPTNHSAMFLNGP